MIKRTISLILACTMLCCMLCLGTGCMDSGSYENNLKKNGNDAITYISEKYDREFIPLSYDLSDYLSDQDEVECYTEGMEPENEHAYILITNEKGETQFSDNYFGFLVRPEIEESISKYLKEEFQEYKVYKENDVICLPDELDSHSTLEDLYIADPEYRTDLTIYIKHEPGNDYDDYDKRANRFIERLASTGHNYHVALFVLGNETFASMSRFEQDEFIAFTAKNKEPDNNKYYFENYYSIDGGRVE